MMYRRPNRRRASACRLIAACALASAIVSAPAAQASSAADDFNRTSLGANWSVHAGSVGEVNQRALGLTGQSGIGIASWSGSSIDGDQFSEATIAPDRVPNMLLQVFARRRSADGARYAFHYDDDPNDGSPGASEWQIKFDGVPSGATRLLAEGAAAAPQPGDTIRLEARGSNPVELTGYHNGRLVLSAADDAPDAVSSGPPGVAFRLKVGTSTSYPSPVVDSWAGGSVTGPSPTTAARATAPPNTVAPTTAAPTTVADGGQVPPGTDPASSPPGSGGVIDTGSSGSLGSGDQRALGSGQGREAVSGGSSGRVIAAVVAGLSVLAVGIGLIIRGTRGGRGSGAKPDDMC